MIVVVIKADRSYYVGIVNFEVNCVLFGCGPLVLIFVCQFVNELGFHGGRINVFGLIVSMLMISSQNTRICTLAQLCHVVLFRFRSVSTYI